MNLPFDARFLFVDGPVAILIKEAKQGEILKAYHNLRHAVEVAAGQAQQDIDLRLPVKYEAVPQQTNIEQQVYSGFEPAPTPSWWEDRVAIELNDRTVWCSPSFAELLPK